MKIFFIIFLLFNPIIFKQKGNIKKYISENLSIVNSINPDDSKGFEDLFPIGNAIGDARVVMLGEQCHGDGATFSAKCRLIKYLHEKKGFNVLAFEADFFALNHNNEVFQKTEDAIADFQRLKKGINNIWSSSDECSSLLNKYIPSTYSTPNPLRISGFDNQIYNLFGGDSAEELVKTTLKEGSFKSDVSQIPDKQFYNAMDTLLSSVYKSRDQLINPSDEVVVLLKDFGTSLGKLLSLSTDRESFGIQVLHNIKTFNDEILHFSDRKFDSQRDSMMAENIIWLLNNKFKNEKVIIWAANSHIGKDGNSNFTPMTDFLLKKVDEQHVYSLAFTSREGYHGVFRSDKLSKALNKNLEKWISDDIDYAFINFKDQDDLKNEYFYMRALGHGNVKDNWQTKFDGLFYIKEMFQSHKSSVQNDI